MTSETGRLTQEQLPLLSRVTTFKLATIFGSIRIMIVRNKILNKEVGLIDRIVRSKPFCVPGFASNRRLERIPPQAYEDQMAYPGATPERRAGRSRLNYRGPK